MIICFTSQAPSEPVSKNDAQNMKAFCDSKVICNRYPKFGQQI